MSICQNRNHRGPDLEGDCDCQDWMKHTPTPWKTWDGDTQVVLDAQGFAIADCRVRDVGAAKRDPMTNCANADFITLACNTHNDTLAAMKLAREYTDKGQPENADGILVAAIAKAEGRT